MNGPKDTKRATCLVVVIEADGFFEGRRRFRLPIQGFLTALLDAMNIRDDKKDVLCIEYYNPKLCAFRDFDTLERIPKGSLFLKVTSKPVMAKPPLALPWREFDDVDHQSTLKVGSHTLRVVEESNSGKGTGTNLWDGAIALVRFLEETKVSLSNQHVLEVGAGTGLVGIAAHLVFGASRVVLTDLEYSMDNLKANIRANHNCCASSSSSFVNAQILDWFDRSSCDRVLENLSPDVILAADVVWVEELVFPLVATLEHICRKKLPPPIIFLSYQQRSKAVGDVLFQSLEEANFETEEMTSPSIRRTKLRIYKIQYNTPTVSC